MRECLLKFVAVVGKEHEIICIADIAFCFESVLHVLIELVHVNIYEKLAREVSQRQPFVYATSKASPCWYATGTETTDDFCVEREDAWIGNVSREDVEEYMLVDGGEEFADVALEYPTGACVIARDLVCE